MLHADVPRIAGVYAINSGSSVYVGQSDDIVRRNTYRLAELLELSRGIVAEMPGSTRKQRIAEESRVAELFTRRGFIVCGPKGPPSATTRARQSASQSGKPKLKLRGIVRSPEVRARMSEGRTKAWARRKAAQSEQA